MVCELLETEIHYDYHYWICVSLGSNTLLWCVNCWRLKYIMIIITGSVLAWAVTLWCVNCRRLKYIMIIITGSVLAWAVTLCCGVWIAGDWNTLWLSAVTLCCGVWIAGDWNTLWLSAVTLCCGVWIAGDWNTLWLSAVTLCCGVWIAGDWNTLWLSAVTLCCGVWIAGDWLWRAGGDCLSPVCCSLPSSDTHAPGEWCAHNRRGMGRGLAQLGWKGQPS